MLKGEIKTRFCPSPTGRMHLGNARTALFSYLLAHSVGGEFLLRIEDTDRERSREEYDEGLQKDLEWMGLLWSEGPGVDAGNGPYHQSKRQAIYDDYYTRLQASGIVYPCFCSEEQLALTRRIQRSSGQPPRYPGTCRNLTEEDINKKLEEGLRPTLRFRVAENQQLSFTDLVRGEQKFSTSDIGDFIVRRANGTPPFMFCNAIDDALMGVTVVLRGEDHLTNTPRQIMILQALALSIPHYGHISLIVGNDGSPLSKRHGSQSIQQLRELGYLPEALVNYLARLGHYYKDEGFTTLSQLAAKFSVEALNKAPAKYNQQQLDYWQKEAIMHMPAQDLWDWLTPTIQQAVPAEKQALFLETVKPNILFPKDVNYWVHVCFSAKLPMHIEQKSLLADVATDYFKVALACQHAHPNNYQHLLATLKKELGIKGKSLFQPLRMVLTGEKQGPELDKLFLLMEPQTIEERFKDAIENL